MDGRLDDMPDMLENLAGLMRKAQAMALIPLNDLPYREAIQALKQLLPDDGELSLQYSWSKYCEDKIAFKLWSGKEFIETASLKEIVARTMQPSPDQTLAVASNHIDSITEQEEMPI